MGVATVTGGGAGGGVCVDCLQPVEKMQMAKAIQQACRNSFVAKCGVNFSERGTDPALSEKNELEAR
jgi:hypothetical protein